MKTCECPLFATGLAGCDAQPRWLVSVGDRRYDAQRTCGRHLHRTCQAMAAAEDKPPGQVKLRITEVTR